MPSDQQLSEHAMRAARTYGAAADHYVLAQLSFWDRFGAATVARLSLEQGATVLDLCCGAGASAIPAARSVGAAERVLGIDAAAPLLKLAAASRRHPASDERGFRDGHADWISGLGHPPPRAPQAGHFSISCRPSC